MTTSFTFLPTGSGDLVLVRIRIDAGDIAGAMYLTRESYGAWARLHGVDPAFDTETGDPIGFSVVAPETFVGGAGRAECEDLDLHGADMHPQPGDAPAADLPPGVAGLPLGRYAPRELEAGEDTDDAAASTSGPLSYVREPRPGAHRYTDPEVA